MKKKFVEIIFDADNKYYIVLKDTQEIKKIKQNDLEKALEDALNDKELLLETLSKISMQTKTDLIIKNLALEAIQKVNNSK